MDTYPPSTLTQAMTGYLPQAAPFYGEWMDQPQPYMPSDITYEDFMRYNQMDPNSLSTQMLNQFGAPQMQNLLNVMNIDADQAAYENALGTTDVSDRNDAA